MKLSLAMRLSIVVVTLVLVTIAILGFILVRSTRDKFIDVQREETTMIGASRIEQALQGPIGRAYNEGGWEAVQTFLDDDPLSEIAHQRFRVFIVDSQPQVAAAHPVWMTRLRVDRPSGTDYRIFGTPDATRETEIVVSGGLAIVDDESSPVGTLFALPIEVEERAANAFVGDVWRVASVWLVACIGLAVGSILLLIRGTLEPIQRLTQAANQLSAGEIPSRLPPAHGPEFNALMNAFNEAIDTMMQTDELRKQLVSDIAHELRTPLTNIKSILEAREAGLLTRDASGDSLLATETCILERLVNDFQQLALSDAGQLPVHLTKVPLADVVESGLVSIRQLRSDMEVAIDIPQELRVVADTDRLRQVLSNLFDNSARHQPQGLRLEIRAERRANRALISVLDNGPGIPISDRAHIFQRFYRGEPSRSRQSGGSGLGLAIARALMQAMDGTIRLGESKSGALMILELPAA